MSPKHVLALLTVTLFLIGCTNGDEPMETEDEVQSPSSQDTNDTKQTVTHHAEEEGYAMSGHLFQTEHGDHFALLNRENTRDYSLYEVVHPTMIQIVSNLTLDGTEESVIGIDANSGYVYSMYVYTEETDLALALDDGAYVMFYDQEDNVIEVKHEEW
ncbi:hypothetical protein [Alteribacter aurantiacus]|uniref:hypothetical protein n=1 Tax=Alteribacter aurantiacus TaxID=254410 RepID=UPI00047B4272|nr:hypothetical protein [Alteribacter aurantiacus]